jgi:hypothetical protein
LLREKKYKRTPRHYILLRDSHKQVYIIYIWTTIERWLGTLARNGQYFELIVYVLDNVPPAAGWMSPPVQTDKTFRRKSESGALERVKSLKTSSRLVHIYIYIIYIASILFQNFTL